MASPEVSEKIEATDSYEIAIQKSPRNNSIATVELSRSPSRVSPKLNAILTQSQLHECYASSQSLVFEAQDNVFETLMANEAESNGTKQNIKQLLLSRIETMQKTSEEFHSYLKGVVTAETKHEDNLHKLLPKESMGTTDKDKMTVHNAGTALMGMGLERYKIFRKLNDNILQKVVTDLHEIHQTSKQQKVMLRKKIKTSGVQIKRLTERLHNLWKEYQEALQEASFAPIKDAVTAEEWKEYKETTVDPSIIGKRYLSVQQEYARTQHEYHEIMNEVLNEIVFQDEKRIDGMKAVLTDYFNAEKAKTMSHLRLIDSAMKDIQQIDKRRDINAFIGARVRGLEQMEESDEPAIEDHLDHDDKSKNRVREPMVFHFTESQMFDTKSRHLQSGILSHIELQGNLFLFQARKIKKSSWRNVHAVVTKFGFLHLFNQEGDLEPIITVLMDDVERVINLADPELDLYSFEIKLPKKKSYLCKVVEPDELRLWVDTLFKHCHRSNGAHSQEAVSASKDLALSIFEQSADSSSAPR